MPTIWRRERLEWEALHPGVDAALLHRHPQGGGAALFRMKAGALMPEHGHVVGEQSYVVEGTIDFGEHRLEAGDAMWVEAGERHEVRAVTDAFFIAVAPPKRTP
jgi:quercetin dioxygenase-like cupin family protein